MKWKLLALILLLSGLATGQTVTTSYRFTTSTPDVGTTANGGAANETNSGTQYRKITWTVTGTVATCSVRVDSSADNITYTAGGAIAAQTCTSNGASTINTGVFNYTRINVTAISGGGSVKVVYQGFPTQPSGGGTVSSVGLTVNGTSPSGVWTVTGSPVTGSGTLNLNIAGTSGGVACFTSGTVMGSSSALIANTLVKGGGAGACPGLSGATDDGTTFTLPRIFTQSATDSGTALFNNAALTLTESPSGTHTGATNVLSVTNSSAMSQAQSGRMRGINITLNPSGSGALTRLEGLTVNANATNTAVSTNIGINDDTEMLNTSGTTAANYGILLQTGQAAAGGTITQDDGLRIGGPSLSGVLTHHAGIHFLTGQSTGANNSDGWAILQDGAADKNQFGLTFTTSRCAAVGTAASPSVASCSGAPAGAFSCATNASAATCTINTTAVTANSQIFIQESAAEGTVLGVTCNTAPTVVPAILEASRVAGTSFTINMPTITTNPACFVYSIVN